MPFLNRTALAAIIAVALLLAGCTVTVLPGAPAVDVDRPGANESTSSVDQPRPDPGLPNPSVFPTFEVGPSTLRAGSVLFFRVQVRTTGYLTISAMSPDERVVVLARNVPVQAGPMFLYPPIGAGNPLQAGPPFGRWSVRAQWSPTPTAARYEGVMGRVAWTSAILADLGGVAGAGAVERFYNVSQP